MKTLDYAPRFLPECDSIHAIRTPVPVSREVSTLNGREIEALLQGELIERTPWAAATMKAQTGEELYIREARIEAAWVAVHEFREVVVAGHGFSDIVGAGVDVERLGRYRKRIQDPHVLIGMFGGKLAGLVHGRLMHEDITISHPTMTFDRGRPPGAALF